MVNTNVDLSFDSVSDKENDLSQYRKGVSVSWKNLFSRNAIYTNGKVSVSSDGEYMACICNSDVNIIDLSNGEVV